MSREIEITTDPTVLATRAWDLMVERELVWRPWSEGEKGAMVASGDRTAKQVERAEQNSKPRGTLAHRARAYWAFTRGPGNDAATRALTEFTYARALDGLTGDPKALHAFLVEEQLPGRALSAQTKPLADTAFAIAALATELREHHPALRNVEGMLVDLSVDTTVPKEAAENAAVLEAWQDLAAKCLELVRAAGEIVATGTGLPEERRYLSPAPLIPTSKNATRAILNADMRRLDTAGVDVDDIGLVMFGKRGLGSRVRTSSARAAEAAQKTTARD